MRLPRPAGFPPVRFRDYHFGASSIYRRVSEGSPRIFDWQSILAGLAQLHRDNPQVLERNVLVGGAACLFYRDQLERINDPDFRVRVYAEEEEKVWLSRDADFATTELAEMPDIAGSLPLGRLQAGFLVGAEEFKENSRHVEVRWDGTQFAMLIADPLDLWREKEAAMFRRGRPQDSLHLEVLGTTLEWETARYAEKVATGELAFDQWASRIREVQRRWPSILNNQKLRDRLIAVGVPEIASFLSLS